MPEMGLEVPFGALQVGAGLGWLYVVTEGPRLANGELTVTDPCSGARGSVTCAQNSAAVESERAFGRFSAWVPEFHLGYTF
jgi:hypothetical protein